MRESGDDSDRSYDFEEYCILPGHYYDVTGTCVENPRPRDDGDRHLLRKGKNEPTFLISWRSESEFERTIRNRAVQYALGGAAVTVLCAGLLLHKFGWL